jgi:hypothetical protein
MRIRTAFVVCIRRGEITEQHREESNQMLGVEGVQKMELTHVVASGTNQRIYFFYAVHPDCSASDINIRVTKQPEHGTVEIRFEASKLITSRPKNTSAAIHSSYSFSSRAASLGKFIST